MTLDEAIEHAEDVAKNSCSKCGEEHRQLTEWLKELKQFKNEELVDISKRMMLKNKKWIFNVHYCLSNSNAIKYDSIVEYAPTEIDAYNMLIEECIRLGCSNFVVDSMCSEDIN